MEIAPNGASDWYQYMYSCSPNVGGGGGGAPCSPEVGGGNFTTSQIVYLCTEIFNNPAVKDQYVIFCYFHLMRLQH